MRIQCDSCEHNLAELVCCSDDAALCKQCDLTVHAANKVANSHERVPLFSGEDRPNCDICQNRVAFFFCHNERSLLCRACDVSIHSVNAHSKKHLRFLLPGTRVALDSFIVDSSNSVPQSVSESPEFAARKFSHVDMGENSRVLNSQKQVGNTSKFSQPPKFTQNPSTLSRSKQPAITKSSSHGTGLDLNKQLHDTSYLDEGFAPQNQSQDRNQSWYAQNSFSSMSNRDAGKSSMSEGDRGPRYRSDPHSGGLSGNNNGWYPQDPYSMQSNSHLAGSSENHHGDHNSMENDSRDFNNDYGSSFYNDLSGAFKIDELLNIPDLAGGYTLGDIGSSKAERGADLGDLDWTEDLSLVGEQYFSDYLADLSVPEIEVHGDKNGSSRPGTGRGQTGNENELFLGSVPEINGSFDDDRNDDFASLSKRRRN